MNEPEPTGAGQRRARVVGTGRPVRFRNTPYRGASDD